MDNKELRKVLRSDKEKIVVPDRLKPENIEAILNAKEGSAVSADVIEATKRKIPRKARRFATIVAAVAVLVLVLGVVPAVRRSIVYAGYYVKADNGFKQLKSYKKLENYLKAKQDEEKRIQLSDMIKGLFDGAFKNVSLESSTSSQSGTILSGSQSMEFSDTNVRTEGVSEADIIKTDGEYIYACSSNALSIIKADGEATSLVARYSDKGWLSDTSEMLIFDKKLIILSECVDLTNISVLDVSDVNAVSLLESFSVEGEYKECRMYGEYLYVYTNSEFNGYSQSALIPKIDGEEMDCSKVYLTDNGDYRSYYIMSSYYIGDESKLVDYVSILNDGEIEAYVSEDNIYLLSSKDDVATEILKFSYDDGVIEAKSTAEVSGIIDDVFSVDEYNGYLRLVITSSDSLWSGNTRNTLYVFDEEMNITGKIEDIAPGESVYSARFDGSIGYFVTYRQVDPLFSVDLSDPHNPRIIGKLKIPGFSEYMLMWGEDKMIGIGCENFRIKLSMFDISDPANVTEESKWVMDEAVGVLPFYGKHKAILVDGDKNILGFCMQRYDDFQCEYGIFSYNEGRFVKKASVEFDDEYENRIRGLYIGDYIYVVNYNGHIRVIDMESYEIVKEF